MQTQLTDTKRSHQTELEKVNGQITRLTQENQQLAQIKTDYDILEQLIDENPDLAEQLFERAGKLSPRGRPATAQQGTAQASPEVLQEVRQLRSMIEAKNQEVVTAQQQEKLAQTDHALGERLKGLLAEHELDESWLPSAREYVLAVARRIPTLDLEEVPYVFAEWAKPLQERLNNQLTTWRNGKLMDQRTLPPSPGTSAIVTGNGAKGALDRNTKSILEERLKQSLGWRNE